MEATLVNPTPAPPQAETAGPLGHMNYDSLENLLASHRSPSLDASDDKSEQKGEQALESHEVIELQAFSERKVWIGEKIKLLEGMPPTHVYADLDAVRASAESGLPTRKQLEQWLIEHDKIERETEIFDSGELKKFKKITKAASKRNLSPQDTDIIELTLIAIQEFDKLLHLLRDRSENLDLLGSRLSWEEQRRTAWADHRQLMLDLRNFLSQRARWSPSVYDTLPQAEGSIPTPTLSRRGSVASLASEASSSSCSGFSRSARFRMGEALSREAAQFAGRISSLRHGKIAAAGRALDKLIENSSRSIPEELLDEQENLEREGTDAMEDVGKFIMSVVTQWRKADEFYVETMKDQASAQSLLDDIEAAQLTHPSSRQDSAFSARAGAIVKRLSSRDNPCSAVSGFPRPTHTLFPDQPSANNSVTKVLGEELETGLSLAARLERGALDYHVACEAVRRAEHSVTSADELSNLYVPVLRHILNGVEPSNGDGTPPDVTTELCLRETKHAAFLALLPSLLHRLDKYDEEAGSILPIAQASLLGLADINVEPGFKDRLSSAIRRLEDVRTESERTRAVTTERVDLLRDVRRLWVSAGSILKDLGTIRSEFDDLMEQQKWKSSTASHLPPTPESMNASLPLSSRTSENATEQIALLQARFDQDVHTGVSALPGAVGPGLRMYLVKCREGLSAILEHSRQMIQLSDSINRQALAMTAIRDETHDLQTRLEDTESRFDVLAEQILDESSPDDLDDRRLELASDATSIQAACQTFMDSLPHRVVFVSPDSSGIVASNTSTPRRRISPPLDLTLDALPSPPFDPPIDLTRLDHVVRADCNAFALHIAGGVSSLQRKIAHLDVVQDAHTVDLKLVILKEAITLAEERFEAIRVTVSTVPDTFGSIDQLARVAGEVGPLFDARRSEISRSLSPIRQLLYKMDTSCSKSPASKYLSMSRSQTTDDMEAKFHAWSDGVKALLLDLRQREERLRVAQREQIEQERLAAEAAEKLEKERAEAEAKRKADEEREREEAEKAERLHREQVEVEERMCRERAEAAQEQARKETVTSPSLAFPTVNDDITSNEDDSDVFSSPEPSMDLSQVQFHVTELRRRLRSLGINASVKPSSSSSSPLPTVERHNVMASQLAEVTNEATQLPANISSVLIDAELKSLRDELENSHQLLPQALGLARFGTLVQDCDNALSDLLEHIDSYPAPPSGPLLANYISSSLLPPEEQMGGRLTFTRNLINNLEEEFTRVADEPKASSERGRIVQTWAELESMAFDRINGRKSRPPSTISSGRQSRASVGGPRPNSRLQKKPSPYLSLSSRSSTRGSVRGPAPAHPSTSTRRVPHNAEPMPNRSSSRLSVVSSNRSVSGPLASTSRLFNSTFSSRQRTTSLSSATSSPVPNNNPGRRSMEPSRFHPSQASHLRRTVSPTPSDASGVSRSFTGATRPISTWGRPPRLSFPSSNAHKSPPKSKPPPPPPRKPYVANPKSKLDVAVGDVVNKLPEDVDIKVEVAQETWQDRSGKYWIGGEDPKLCFCRILRSHAVMVRVGGGWTELSKFIQTHFADMVRLLPEPTMSYLGSREEKWISSSTLLEAPELITPPRPPKTPEPGSGGVSQLPSFALSTPSGRSPQSIRTHSSPGSPLVALQFLRRVEGEGGLARPSTPTKSSLHHGRPSPLPFAPMRSPNRAPVWKP